MHVDKINSMLTSGAESLNRNCKLCLSNVDSGFGDLGVSMLASGTQDCGFAPDRSRRIFPAGKIHSMPSFGGEVK
jgi:hypothetical protein